MRNIHLFPLELEQKGKVDFAKKGEEAGYPYPLVVELKAPLVELNAPLVELNAPLVELNAPLVELKAPLVLPVGWGYFVKKRK